ncbi:192_t:CDS:2 [Rhizophagus irregularis]|nr:192_t:CDS:2 [Rhizophagus irregularis]
MSQLIYTSYCAHILYLIGEIWQKFNPFAILKEFLAKNEVTNDSTNETLKNILKTLSDPFKFGTISVYIHFISIYARQFIQDTDFFQKQNKPIFPFVKERLNHLSAFLESNCNSQDFGPDLDTTIISHYFNPPDFYPVFCLAFEAAFNKFNAHIPSHPTHSLFWAAQNFDPKYILLGPLERKNLHQYSAIRELANPSDELLCKWSIYCGLQLENSVGEINLEEYWMNLGDKLPILSKIALDYIWYLYHAVVWKEVFQFITIFWMKIDKIFQRIL